jgi:hypothetical protein
MILIGFMIGLRTIVKIFNRKEMIIVKKLLFILMIVALILTMGCEPPKPPVVESGIVCAGGHYSVQYKEWSQTGCEGESIQAGTFWFNLNGRLFLLGNPIDIKKVFDVYGKCPKSFIKEIVMKAEYLEEVSKSIK